MLTRATAITLALAVTATLGFGGIAPQPAEANDTGKVLAGIAAGALVYGILDQADNKDRFRRYDRDRNRYDRYDNDRRGYYDGNRRSWKYDQGRQGRADYQFRRHQDIRRYESNRRSYNRGWDNGYDRGHEVGYGRGYNRGYDHGWNDGYGTGRYGGWSY